MTSRAALLKGGETGPAIVPGKPETSLLIQVLEYVDPPRMPPDGKLAAKDIALLTRWVKMGAPWPKSSTKTIAAKVFTITEAQRRFWSFQPVKRPAIPVNRDGQWSRNPIDRFVLARLEAKKLRPARPADRRTYIRRVTFDLTGLPPTPRQVADFLGDRRPGAHDRLVDRLLASPAYGERWGRHWLDLVRYTDSSD